MTTTLFPRTPPEDTVGGLCVLVLATVAVHGGTREELIETLLELFCGDDGEQRAALLTGAKDAVAAAVAHMSEVAGAAN